MFKSQKYQQSFSLVVFFFFLVPKGLALRVEKSSAQKKQKKSSVYFDSKKVLIKGKNKFSLKDDVVILSPWFILTADLIHFDKENNHLEIEGNVLGVFSKHIIVAESVQINLKKSLFSLKNGSLVSGDSKRKMAIRDFILNLAKQRKTGNNRTKKKLREKMWRDTKKIFSKEETSLYFKIEAESLKKITKSSYRAIDSSLTFCFCEKDETPAWQLDSSNILYKNNESIFLKNPLFRIKGIPLLYLPSLTIPATNKRKSGFLFPFFSYTEDGLVYRQEYYLPLNPHSEMFFGTEVFEQRGLKISSNYQALWSPYSFSKFYFEGIEDYKWLKQNKEREKIISFYEDNPSTWFSYEPLVNCLASESDQSKCFNLKVRPHLGGGRNKLRGKFEWHNSFQLADRTNFLSKGFLASDHRYMRELSLDSGKRNLSPFIENRGFISFANSRMGFYSKILDPIQSGSFFSGYQVPIVWQYNTHYTSLFDFDYPVYGRVSGQYKKISLFKPLDEIYSTEEELNLILGNGDLGKLNFEVLAPLAYRKIFTCNFFLKGEGRGISSHYSSRDLDIKKNNNYESLLGKKNTFLAYVTTGLNFSLPVEGHFNLKPETVIKEEGREESLKRTLKHKIFWNMNFVYRSDPLRQGQYSSANSYYKWDDSSGLWEKNEEKYKPLTYTLKEKDFLNQEKKISFSTIHRLILSKAKTKESSKKQNDFDPQKNKEILLFTGSFDYDFEKVNKKIRNFNLSFNEKEKKPLSPLKTYFSFNWKPLSSTFRSEFDFESKDFSHLDFILSLGLPFNLNLFYGYNFKKSFEQDSMYSNIFHLMTKEFSLNLSFIKNSFLKYSIQWKNNQSGSIASLSRTLSLKYEPSSNCWGLRASWSRGEDLNDFRGTYYLSFYIKFLNNLLESHNLLGSL